MRIGSVLATIGIMLFLLGGLIIPFSSMAGETVLYSEDFEESNGGYTVTAATGMLSGWEYGTPVFGEGVYAHSGTKCWGTNLDGRLEFGTDGSLKSLPTNLPPITTSERIYVSFWGFIKVDSMNDRGQMHVSNDGVNWQKICDLFYTMEGGRNEDGDPREFGEAKWRQYVFDVSDFAGGPLYIKFRALESEEYDDWFDAPPHDMAGFYIDDVRIVLRDGVTKDIKLTLEASEHVGILASCPWLLVWDGSEFVFENDIYSTARTVGKQFTDYIFIENGNLSEVDGRYQLQLREVREEVSFTDMVKLMVVDHESGTRVGVDGDGEILSYAVPLHPQSAVDQSGQLVLDDLAQIDSAAAAGYHEGYIDLDFGDLAISGTAKLVLRFKGFVVDAARSRAPTYQRPWIEIQTQDASLDWSTRYRINPRDNWSTHVFDLAPYLPDPAASQKVRLAFTSCNFDKYHQIDFAGLDIDNQPSQVEIYDLEPVSALRNESEDVLELLLSEDGQRAQIDPGERISLLFDTPAQNLAERNFIFVSNGYYVPVDGTFFIYTWDGLEWRERDSYSYPEGYEIDQTHVFDLSLFLPDPDGEYKVRIWQDYRYESATIDWTGLTIDGVSQTLLSAYNHEADNRPAFNEHLYSPGDVTSLLSSSDERRLYFLLYPWYPVGRTKIVDCIWQGPECSSIPQVRFEDVGGDEDIYNIANPTPLISWSFNDELGHAQTEYEVQVWKGPGGIGQNVWTHSALSPETSVIYDGEPLIAGQNYYARVRGRDDEAAGCWSAWSEILFRMKCEDCQPPLIARTAQTVALSDSSQTPEVEIEIEARITDDVSVQSAVLYYRPRTTGAYFSVEMRPSSTDLYRGIVPHNVVLHPGFDYYIWASDGTYSSTSPVTNAAAAPHQIPVLSNYPPVIDHLKIESAPCGNQILVEAEIWDDTNFVQEARLHYRVGGEFIYRVVDMAASQGAYSGIIEQSAAFGTKVEYFISAGDDYGVTSYSGTFDQPHEILLSGNCNSAPGPGDLKLVEEDRCNVQDATPAFEWIYVDADNHPQTGFEVEVWSDTGRHGAPLWDPQAFDGDFTSVIYNGSPLQPGYCYYFSLRVSDGYVWSDWQELGFCYDAGARPITIDPASVALDVGEHAEFKVSGGLDPINWSFSEDSVCKLTSVNASTARVEALSAGNTHLLATDFCGFQSQAQISVVDPNRSPVAVCQDVTLATEPGVCTAGETSVDGGSYDPDGDSIIIAQSPAGPFPLGTTAVTLTVTDDGDASTSCTAMVTVQDTEPPSLDAPADVTVPQVGCGDTSVDLGTPILNDNCGPASSTVTNDAPVGFPPGSTTVTWTATDSAGNSTTATQTATVVSATPPCPTCDGEPVVVSTVIELDANNLPGTAGVLAPFSSFNGETISIDLGSRPLKVTSTGRISVPAGCNLQPAQFHRGSYHSTPNLHIKSTCTLLIEKSTRTNVQCIYRSVTGVIETEAQGGKAGDIFIEFDSTITIEGGVQSFQDRLVDNHASLSGAILIRSTCGDIVTGKSSWIVTWGEQPGSGAITIRVKDGDIDINGLVMNRTKYAIGEKAPPVINLLAVAGSVTVDGGNLVLNEWNLRGAKYDMTSGLVVISRDSADVGRINIRAAGDINISRDVTGLTLNRRSFAAVATVVNSCYHKGGEIRVKSMQGRIRLKDRALQANGTGNNSAALIKLVAERDISVESPAALDEAHTPAITTAASQVNCVGKGGTNVLRSCQADVTIKAGAQVHATGYSDPGANKMTAGGGTVTVAGVVDPPEAPGITCQAADPDDDGDFDLALNIHTISGSAGDDGQISPAGRVMVENGDSQIFTITPNPNFRVADVQVDDISVGAVACYKFENILGDHSIEAKFYEMKDTDKDNLFDYEEINFYGTAPDHADTDNDGIRDDEELAMWNDQWNSDNDADGVSNLLDWDADGDRYSDGEEKAQGLDPGDPDSKPGVFPIEVGEVNADHRWERVTFNRNFFEPVVVARLTSFSDDNLAVVRIQNVTNTGFEIRVQNWEYPDGQYFQENIGYIVMEAGSFKLPGEIRVKAGYFETGRTGSFESISFQEAFNEEPIVMAAVNSSNENDAVTLRLKNITQTGFQIKMQEQSANPQVHAAETIAYIAWEPSTGNFGAFAFEVGKTETIFNHQFSDILFSRPFAGPPMFVADIQTHESGPTAYLRWQNITSTGVKLKVAKAESQISEPNHTGEVVGYMAFSLASPDSLPKDTSPKIKKTIPRDGAGITNEKKVPIDSSFAVLIEADDGIDITDPGSVRFTVNDGNISIYERDLGDASVVRTVKLNSDDPDTQVKKLYVAYDRSMDDVHRHRYDFDADVHIQVNVVDCKNNTILPANYDFKVESEAVHLNNKDTRPRSDLTADADTTILTISSNDELNGLRLVYGNSEPVYPQVAPSEEIPPLDLPGVDSAAVPVNLDPPTVFNRPVIVYLPYYGDGDVRDLNLYWYDGQEWVFACSSCNKGGVVQPGGEDWIVPGSLTCNDETDPATLEFEVHHFSAVQAGFSANDASSDADDQGPQSSNNSGDQTNGGCFVSSAGDEWPQAWILFFIIVLGCPLLIRNRILYFYGPKLLKLLN